MPDTQNPDRQAIGMRGWKTVRVGRDEWFVLSMKRTTAVTYEFAHFKYECTNEAEGWRWLRRVAEFIDAMEEEATRHDHANR